MSDLPNQIFLFITQCGTFNGHSFNRFRVTRILGAKWLEEVRYIIDLTISIRVWIIALEKARLFVVKKLKPRNGMGYSFSQSFNLKGSYPETHRKCLTKPNLLWLALTKNRKIGKFLCIENEKEFVVKVLNNQLFEFCVLDQTRQVQESFKALK